VEPRFGSHLILYFKLIGSTCIAEVNTTRKGRNSR